MPSKVRDEISYPFLNFNGATMLNQLNHVSKRGPKNQEELTDTIRHHEPTNLFISFFIQYTKTYWKVIAVMR